MKTLARMAILAFILVSFGGFVYSEAIVPFQRYADKSPANLSAQFVFPFVPIAGIPAPPKQALSDAAFSSDIPPAPAFSRARVMASQTDVVKPLLSLDSTPRPKDPVQATKPVATAPASSANQQGRTFFVNTLPAPAWPVTVVPSAPVTPASTSVLPSKDGVSQVALSSTVWPAAFLSQVSVPPVKVSPTGSTNPPALPAQGLPASSQAQPPSEVVNDQVSPPVFPVQPLSTAFSAQSMPAAVPSNSVPTQVLLETPRLKEIPEITVETSIPISRVRVGKPVHTIIADEPSIVAEPSHNQISLPSALPVSASQPQHLQSPVPVPEAPDTYLPPRASVTPMGNVPAPASPPQAQNFPSPASVPQGRSLSTQVSAPQGQTLVTPAFVPQIQPPNTQAPTQEIVSPIQDITGLRPMPIFEVLRKAHTSSTSTPLVQAPTRVAPAHAQAHILPVLTLAGVAPAPVPILTGQTPVASVPGVQRNAPVLLPVQPSKLPASSTLGPSKPGGIATGPAKGRAIKAAAPIPVVSSTKPTVEQRMKPRVIKPPVKSPLPPGPVIPDDCVPGLGTAQQGRSVGSPRSPPASTAASTSTTTKPASSVTNPAPSSAALGAGSKTSSTGSAVTSGTGSGTSITGPISATSGAGAGSTASGSRSAALVPAPPPPSITSKAASGMGASPPIPGIFIFCGPPRIFSVDECSTAIIQKYGGDFSNIQVFLPEPADKFGSGFHFKITLKKGVFGGRGFKNLALQVMAYSSTAGGGMSRSEVLGSFVPYNKNFKEGPCNLGASSPFHTDTVTTAQAEFVCANTIEMSDNVVGKTILLEFGNNNVQEYHIRWRYLSDGQGDTWEQVQLQLFTVAPEGCLIHTAALVDAYSIRIPVSPPVSGVSFDCHGKVMAIQPGAEAIEMEIYNRAYADQFLKSLCLEDSGEYVCETDTGLSLSINLYYPLPQLNGWAFIEIKGIVSSGKTGIWYVQALSLGGRVIGSWMSAEAMECSDLVSVMDVHLPSSSRMPQYQTPEPPEEAPHVLAMDIDPGVKPRQVRTIIVFRYYQSEAAEVAKGFQLQLFTSMSKMTPPCMYKYVSPIYVLNSRGVNWDKVAKLPYPEKCLGEKVGLGTPQLPTGAPILLQYPEYEESCRTSPMIEETDKSTLPTMPNLILRAALKPTEVSEFAFSATDLPAEREKLLRAQKHNQAKAFKGFKKDDFYVKCEELLKGCVGDRKECVKKRSCQIIVTYRKLEDKSEIEIYGQTSKYVAFGISKDRKMGNDSVVECVREDGAIRIYRSFNTKFFMNRRLRDHSSINILEGFYVNGWLYCRFQLDRITKIQGLTFDLVEEEYYLLTARGDEAEDTILGGIGFHGPRRHSSEAKHKLMMRFGETTLYKWNKFVHGVSMIVTWIFLLPIATFAVRYFKETYDGKYMCGMRIWFGLHVVIISIVVTLTLVAIISAGFMTQFKFGKTIRGWYFHNTAGFVLLGLMVAQVILGIGIFKNKKAELAFINKIHGVLGHAQFFLAFAIIYKSKDLRGGIECNDPAVLITWIVIYFLIHILMSYQVCYIDYVQGQDVSRVYALPALAPARITESEPNAPGGVVRKSFFGVLIFCALVTTAVLIINYISGGRDCVEVALYDSDKTDDDDANGKDRDGSNFKTTTLEPTR